MWQGLQIVWEGRNMLPYSSIANSVIYSYTCLKMWRFMYSLKYLPVKRFSMTQSTSFLCNIYVVNMLKYVYIKRNLIDSGSNETVQIHSLKKSSKY